MLRKAKGERGADLATDESGAAMVEYVIALSFATLMAVLAMYEVGDELVHHFFWTYALAIQPM